MGFELITPQIAEDYLKKNVNNYRKIDKNRVDSYALDMAAGKWVKNGEAIVFGKNGELQDGQHRLNAIIKSNTPVWIYVVRNADNTRTYDVGTSRTVQQILRSEDSSHCSLAPAISKIVIAGEKSMAYGKGIIMEYAQKHKEELSKAQQIVSAKGNTGRKAACAAIVYSFIRLEGDEFDENEMLDFFRVVNTGNTAVIETARECSPALIAKKQLESSRSGGHIIQGLQMEITYKAIDDFRRMAKRVKLYTTETEYAQRLLSKVRLIDGID